MSTVLKNRKSVERKIPAKEKEGMAVLKTGKSGLRFNSFSKDGCGY